MSEFLTTWHRAAVTTAGLFWMAFWAFGLGYLVSAMIQVFVTRARMQRAMGESGPQSVALGTVFGFISSSCSFAALSTTRALFAKGAGLVPSLAFLLASTNLVVELGIVIAVFLGWQFVAGEYVGGLLLILLMWLIVRWTLPRDLEEEARERARTGQDEASAEGEADWRERITSREGWRDVARAYAMEWGMVWKDVAIGFTVAGVIAAFVPSAFFQALFVGAGQPDPSPGQVVLHTLIGPLAAFLTFIGSMGNIPLAAVLFGHGVSFAGVMAFIFSDLVVFPVLRIQAEYYGWRMAAYILVVFLVALVATSLLLHHALALAGALPDPSAVQNVTEREFFALDATLALNAVFLLLSGGLLLASRSDDAHDHDHDHGETSLADRALQVGALIAFLWLGAGLLLGLAG